LKPHLFVEVDALLDMVRLLCPLISTGHRQTFPGAPKLLPLGILLYYSVLHVSGQTTLKISCRATNYFDVK